METYSKLRNELNELGYTQTLKPECVPLVTKLLADLKTTTESLHKYMKISQQAIEERDFLELGAEPYKCDNAKLIRECNELHLAFIQFKEQHEKVQKDLKTQIVLLENQLKDSNLEKENFQKNIKDLQGELAVHTRKGEKGKPHSRSTTKRETGKSSGFQLNSAMATADQKIAYLNKEVKKLKEEQLQYNNNTEFYKLQLKNRDEEIKRLNQLLEGGKPLKALSDECCYRNIDNKMGALQDEMNILISEKNKLHNQLKEALSKQHEAMRRALHLAERNKELEKELKDIDEIALAVEAECNNKVRNNADKVTRLQDRLNESVIMIQNLEREYSKLKQEKQELSSDLDAIKLEKKNLQELLDSETFEKKRLTDRINNFTVIERDLNLEIDRLMRLSAEQKRKIAELESQVAVDKVKLSSFEMLKPLDEHLIKRTEDEDLLKSPKSKKGIKSSIDKGAKHTVPGKKFEHKKTCKKYSSVKSSSTKKDADKEDVRVTSDFTSQLAKCCCEAGGCVKSMKDLLDKEMEYRQTQAMQQIESLKQEKDYYMKEFHKLSEKLRNVPTHDRGPSDILQQQYEELLRNMSDKNRTISELQNEIRTLTQEKNALIHKPSTKSIGSDITTDGECINVICKRKCRELEIIRGELKYLEKENGSLKEKIRDLNESLTLDKDRIKKAFQDMEGHIQKLEDERRDLMMNQNTDRSSMSQLADECNHLKQQLRNTQAELNNLRANYAQLKNLHDQTDRALNDTQNQLLRAETELQNFQSRMQSSHRESATYERDIAKLQGDIEVMKSQLTKLDKEKDDLLNIVDEKTEKIDQLENKLRDKKSLVINLEGELKELKRKLSKTSEEVANHELQMRSSRQEIAMLESDIENEKKLKDSALQENRRLQNDLASVTCDCKDARKQLEITNRQVEDLKTQLQHYVAEIKRAEDLISQKELERSEILDQFKCLSEEANVLENNNHTLESEATQSRVQLSVALDHASDLELKLQNQDGIIRSYEKQIADLTSQIASLEIQSKQGNSHQERVSDELKQMKDLCIKLDQEKDQLKRELRNRDEQKGSVQRDIDRLTKENQELRKAVDKDQNNLDGVEKLLADARQEVIEQRLLNEDLQSEIKKLKTKIEELQERLSTTSEQLDLYQEKALEYSQQIKQLRREIANERFSRSREDDTKRYPSLNPTTSHPWPSSKLSSEPNCYKHCNKKKCAAARNKSLVPLKGSENESSPEIYQQYSTIKSCLQRNEQSFISPSTSKNEDISNYMLINSNEEKCTQTIVKAVDCKTSCSNLKNVGTRTDRSLKINISTYASKLDDASSKSNSTASTDGKPNYVKSFQEKKKEYLKNTLISETIWNRM